MLPDTRPKSDSAAQSPALRLLWMLLIVATLYVSYFRNLGAIGLVGPDEPRYAWIARDMAESGDWVTPRLYGRPWFEKPVLYYWGAALSFKLFGVSETTARFPSAIAALLATLAVAWLAWRLYGAVTARWLLLLLPTTVGMIGFSHAAATDMPFSGMLTVAMVFAAVIVGVTRNAETSGLRRTPWLPMILFGFSLGLAVLAKGPAAIILSGASVLLWAALTRRWRDAFRCLHAVAITSFCLTALPWYILCTRRNPDFFRVFIVEHNFKRYLTPEFQHIQPFWYYLPILLVTFLPWTVLLLWSIYAGFLRSRQCPRIGDFTLFVLAWTIVPILFFSASKSKLPGYILPAIPAIGVPLAGVLVRFSEERRDSLRAFSVLSVFGFGLGGTVLWNLLENLHASRTIRNSARAATIVLIAFAIANLLPISLTSKRHRLRQIAFLCVLPILALQLAAGWLLPSFFPSDLSGKTLASELRQTGLPLDQIYVGPIHRGQEFSLNFYLHREISKWNSENPHTGYLLLHSARQCQDNSLKAPLFCEGNPVELRQSGWFVYKVAADPSVGDRSERGTLDHCHGTLGDRQPR